MKSDDSPLQTQYERNNAFGRVHSVCPTSILIGSTLNKLGLPMDSPSAYTLELSPFPTLSTAVRIDAWGIYNAINLVLLSSLSQDMLITRPCLAEPPQLFASPLDTQLGPCRCEVIQLRDEMQKVQIQRNCHNQHWLRLLLSLVFVCRCSFAPQLSIRHVLKACEHHCQLADPLREGNAASDRFS